MIRNIMILMLALPLALQAAANFQLNADLLEIKNPSNTLFRFEKTATKTGDQESVSRKYFDTEGKLVVEEKLSYKSGNLEKLDLNNMQINQTGSLSVEGTKLKFSYTKDGKTKTSEETLDGDLVSSDQIYSHLQKHWDKLMAGETISIRLPVLDRLETVGFKFFKEKDAEVDGVKMTVIKMKPSSFVIAALVSPIMFYFHPTEMRPEGHKVVQVVGRTVPKRKEGDKWKDLDAIMKFRY